MPEWWTYSLSDFLLFSPRTYYRLFGLYNLAIWPTHILAAILGLAILWSLLRGGATRGRIIAAILAACWLWVAWAWLFTRYDTINWAARYFAIGFALQALLLLWTGVARGRLDAWAGADAVSRAGTGIYLFALLVQPLIGSLIGRPWTQAEIFGLTPDPTVAATLGVLLTAARVPWLSAVIPLIWCAVSGATLWAMQSPEAMLMPAVAILFLFLAGWKTWTRRDNRRREVPSDNDPVYFFRCPSGLSILKQRSKHHKEAA